MAYAEFLRARRSLAWHVGVLAVIAVFAAFVGSHTTIDVNGTTRVTSGETVPLGLLAMVGMFFGAIYASSAGSSLNREACVADISWTKPLARTAIALRIVAVDTVAVCLAYAAAVIAALAVVLHAGLLADADARTPGEFALGLGVALMWYGLIQLLTFWGGPSLRAAGGILWPVAFLLEGLAGLPGATGATVRLIDVINPLAYIGSKSDGIDNSVWRYGIDERTLAVFGFAVLFCAIAVTFWPKREV